MLLLGAHLSIAKGFHNALVAAKQLKCNCLQIFIKNQRQWEAPAISPEAIERWRQTRQNLGDSIRHVIGHSGYLINLASDSEKIRRLSVRALADELYRCRLLGIDRLVMHPGSHRGQGAARGIRWVSDALRRLSADAPDVTILLEGTAGAGNCLGGTIEELAQLLDATGSAKQLGFCLDTCHLFAAGYDISSPDAWNVLYETVDRHIGLDRLGCIHVNDSTGTLGSHLDRHAHIGKGRIGSAGFSCLMNMPQLTHIPKIIETPKSESTSLHWDRRNLSVLRRMAERS